MLRFCRDCATLNVEPHDQPTFVERLSQKEGRDEVLLSMDGIVVSGGNTLNQQAIWKAQCIDLVLKQPWSVVGGVIVEKVMEPEQIA